MTSTSSTSFNTQGANYERNTVVPNIAVDGSYRADFNGGRVHVDCAKIWGVYVHHGAP